MKKLVRALMLVLVAVILIIPAFAIAEDAHPPDETSIAAVEAEESLVAVEALAEDVPTIPGEPLTWPYLATIAGATAATLLIVQFLKVPLDKVWKIPTRVFVYFIALAILMVATAFTAGLTIDTALLTVVNAFLVALAAYGSYEITFHKWERY